MHPARPRFARPGGVHNKAQAPALLKPQIQGFWDPPSNLAPPSKGPEVNQGPTQSEWIQMKNMLMYLNQMMTKFH